MKTVKISKADADALKRLAGKVAKTTKRKTKKRKTTKRKKKSCK